MRALQAGVIVVTLCTLTVGRTQTQAQQTNSQSAQAAPIMDASPDTSAAGRRYDPYAGHEHLQGGIWDNALGRINPENKDYGRCVSEWRQIMVSETIHSFVFWTALAMCFALLVALLYICWLLRDRARRLHISVNILTQISNAYIDARDRALDAIEKHNHLADDYNAMAEKMAAHEQQKAGNLKRVRTEPVSAIETDGTTEEPPTLNAELNPVSHAGLDPQLLAHLRQEAEAQARQRLAHQISALNEKNKSLRISMNEVIRENETLRRQQAALKGE